MSGLLLIIILIICVTVAYFSYGGYLSRRLGVDENETTPAHSHRDNIDYVPANRWLLMGHHFASIAGVGPIVGPVIAAAFGWLPVYLWIIVGGIMIGAVHDFAATMLSLRNRGRSIAEVLKQHTGRRGKQFFIIFSFATMILVIAVFTNVVSAAFAGLPHVASASVFFIAVAVIFGLVNRYLRISFPLLTVAGIIMLYACIQLGVQYPVVLSQDRETAVVLWKLILLAYIFISAVLPVWMLIQPRDYLNSFLLYTVMFAGLAGMFFYNPELNLEAYRGFYVELGQDGNMALLFPILFVTVACGAISGFHSLVASGTTAKQINSERDVKFIAFGGMLIEVVLAGLAIIAVASLSANTFSEMYSAGQFVEAFASGTGAFISSIPLLNISSEAAISYVALAVSAFALTSLDTCCRLARYLFSEFTDEYEDKPVLNIVKNRFAGTATAVLLSATLIFSGGAGTLWPLFGASNQLLAALALLAATLWLSRKNRPDWFVKWPMVFMFLVTLSALAIMIYTNAIAGNYLLSGISVLLLTLAVVTIIRILREKLRKPSSSVQS